MPPKKMFPEKIALNPLFLTLEQAAWLRRQPNKQAAIRAAIDAAMEREQNSKSITHQQGE